MDDTRAQIAALMLRIEELEGEVAYQKGQAAFWKAMARGRLSEREMRNAIARAQAVPVRWPPDDKEAA
jgi:hypothetical protein